MTTQFLTSKWGHTLDDANITALVEPTPGTQVIYEYINDCPILNDGTNHGKVYPPNSTVILHNNCLYPRWTVDGEVTKLVIEYNRGKINLGVGFDDVFTNEVVVKHNVG